SGGKLTDWFVSKSLEQRSPGALALLVAVIWGLAFVATRIGLDSFLPPQLTALRFLIAAVPAFVLPRPPSTGRSSLRSARTLFTGQFLLQFFAIAHFWRSAVVAKASTRQRGTSRSPRGGSSRRARDGCACRRRGPATGSGAPVYGGC